MPYKSRRNPTFIRLFKLQKNRRKKEENEKKNQVNLKVNSVTYEATKAGITILPTDVLSGSAEKISTAIIDTSAVKGDKVGTYEATITCEDKQFKLPVRINDTVDIAVSKVEAIIKAEKKNAPVYDFVTEDGIGNTVWVIENPEICKELSGLLGQVGDFYIADGHHRCASAVNVAKMRREQNPDFDGTEEFNFFLAVLFPADSLEIMDYNRVVKDLNGNTEEEFINKISKKFDVELASCDGAYHPEEKHNFGMYLGEKWYKLTAKDGTFDPKNPVDQLDVSILQKNLLTPILNIGDPRTDKRIDFIGGIRGLKELEKRCKEDMTVAFSMYPTTLDDLMSIADANMIMPPKSTWFEPKLLSGLFIHKLK